MTTTLQPQLRVRHVDGEQFVVDIRDHHVFADQPVAADGDDAAPAPTELFVASIATCVAYYAYRFLVRHDIASDGLEVSAGFRIAERPTRIADVDIVLTPPPALPIGYRDAFLAVAQHCTLHNTLRQPPAVQIVLGRPAEDRRSGDGFGLERLPA